jgi:hypothetical protein
MYPEDDAKPVQEQSGTTAATAATAIEPATGPGDEDEFDLTDGYDTGSLASVSVTSSVFAHTYEHGRRYQHFKNGRYPIPNDDQEQNREDMKHAMLMELTDGVLFYAPVGDNPQKILDIGTGTGGCALFWVCATRGWEFANLCS